MNIEEMKPYTAKLYEIMKAESEEYSKTKGAQVYGNAWHQISREEAVVFELEISDSVGFTELWQAYDLVFGIADFFEDQQARELVPHIRDEHPWIKQPAETLECKLVDFQRFGKLFGYSYRKSMAYYFKRDFWIMRAGEMKFSDE